MDAVRASDGQYVALKRVIDRRQREEVEVMQYLNTEPLRSDPRNNAVHLFEVLDVPATDRDEAERIVVMPLLRPWDDPWFETFGEVIAFLTQMFEVILFAFRILKRCLADYLSRVYN